MRRGNAVVGALVVGCAVIAAMLALRDCGGADMRPTSAASDVASRSRGARPTTSPSAIPETPTKPARRHTKSQDTPGAATPSTGGIVVVHVATAEDGAPIAGATVGVQESDAPERTTDADGVARLAHVAPGYQEIRVSARGWISEYGGRTIEAGRETNVSIRLSPACDLAIRVVEARTGAAVAGAKVHRAVVGAKLGLDLVADADGRCVAPSKADSVVRVTASSPGLENGAALVRVGPRGSPPQDVVVRLDSLGRMSGVVRGPDGLPVAGAKVVVAPPTEAVATFETAYSAVVGRNTRWSKTGADGRYVVTELPCGRRWHAVAGGTDLGTSDVVEGLAFAPGAVELVQDFTLRPNCDVTIRVVRADGTPASDARLSVLSLPGGGIGMSGSPAVSPGVYLIRGRPPGPLDVMISGPGEFLGAVRRIEVPAAATFDTAIETGAAPEIRGTVVDDLGGVVAGADVQWCLSPRSSSQILYVTTKTDARGAFHASASGADPTTLTAKAEGFLPSGTVTLTAPCDDARIVLRRAATLAFHAVSGGAPMSKAMIHVLLDDDVEPLPPGPNGPYGSVRIDCPPRGDATMRAFVQGFAPVVRRVRLEAGVVADLGDVEFSSGRTCVARVVDSAGCGVSGAAVRPDDGLARAGSDPAVAVTDADGDAVVTWAPQSGGLPVRAEADGFLMAHAVAQVVGDSPIVLTLARGGLAWGEIVDAAGASVPDVNVRFVNAAGVETSTSKADVNGFFDARVAPGRYVVRADGCDDATVDLVEGGDAHVHLVRRTAPR